MHVRHQRSHLDQSQRAAGSSRSYSSRDRLFDILEGILAHCPVPGSLLTPPNSGVGPSSDDVLAPSPSPAGPVLPAASDSLRSFSLSSNRATTGSVSFSGTMMPGSRKCVSARNASVATNRTHTATRAWGDTLGWFSGTARPTTAHRAIHSPKLSGGAHRSSQACL